MISDVGLSHREESISKKSNLARHQRMIAHHSNTYPGPTHLPSLEFLLPWHTPQLELSVPGDLNQLLLY